MFKDIDVFKCLSVRDPKTRTFRPHTWRELSEADRLLRLPFAYWGNTTSTDNPLPWRGLCSCRLGARAWDHPMPCEQQAVLSVSYFKTAGGREWAGAPRTISANAPPHSGRWQRAAAKLRCCHRLIHNRRRKAFLIIDLDCVTDGSCDITPVEEDVCPGGEARVGSRRE